MKSRIALVTAREALPLDPDMPPLAAALREEGLEVETPAWDDAGVDWLRYGLAVLRSTWDYADRIDEFLSWTDRCAGMTRLENPPAVIRWNTDKHYLGDLARSGVPVVPTRFVEPGEDPAAVLADFLAGREHAGGTTTVLGAAEEFVVKPTVGAGSRDAARYHRSDRGIASAHLERLTQAGRSAMLQPYLGSVDEAGETAVIYLGGAFSHAARKGPLLRRGADFVEGLFAPEEIAEREPAADELEVAARAYRAIGATAPVYARIDLIRDGAGHPVVLELELTEPSLFLAHSQGSARRYARILASRLHG
jgi:O-ureido-D-serine cyclo-ligase